MHQRGVEPHTVCQALLSYTMAMEACSERHRCVLLLIRIRIFG
jgi:hypothetical protein